MKLKLSFLIVIVLFTSCSNKSNKVVQSDYYRQEMEKFKRLATKKAELKIITEPSYLNQQERIKFANLLGISPEELKNEKLYAAINEWMGTPYHWGGTTKNGVDCSAYVQDVYQKVYSFELPRTSIEQFDNNLKAQFTGQKFLQQGDLIFFRLKDEDRVVSHVGIYLQNGRFTGSNSPHGVQIVDLKSKYWQERFVSGARLLKNQ